MFISQKELRQPSDSRKSTNRLRRPLRLWTGRVYLGLHGLETREKRMEHQIQGAFRVGQSGNAGAAEVGPETAYCCHSTVCCLLPPGDTYGIHPSLHKWQPRKKCMHRIISVWALCAKLPDFFQCSANNFSWVRDRCCFATVCSSGCDSESAKHNR